MPVHLDRIRQTLAPGRSSSLHGSVGDCYDNAMCESFFARLECELLDRVRFHDRAEAELAVFDFIEGFYNTRRQHSALGYLSPTAFEQRSEAAA
jgi:putative transposase